MTAIVGPNGSGKSNISEAVMWVLGEQSARSLRSGSMEDVIFAGSSARPALGMAEVSLTLSNTDGTLPIEFTEVTITRRLYRSGESDYYINNSPCRLLDIQELLSDSGLGKGLYSIIGQGRLEEILNSKPEDKRQLIEEAAGITKHKKRKDRALRKIASMDHNLQRAKDITLEIGRQLRPLKNQANKAREYQALSRQLRALDIGLAIADLKELQEEWEYVINLEGDLKEKLSSLKEDLSHKHEATEKLQLEFETKNFFSGDISEKRRKLQSVEEKLRSNINLLDEKNKNIMQRIGEVRHSTLQAEHRKNSLVDQKRWLEKERDSLQDNIDKNNASLVDTTRKIDEVHTKRLDIEASINELKAKTQSENRASDNYQTEMHRLQLSIQTNENQHSFLAKELATITKKRAELYQRIEQKKRDLEISGIELSRLEFQQNELTMLIEQHEQELNEKRNVEVELGQESAGLKARIKTLEDIMDAFPTTEDVTKSLSTLEMTNISGLIKEAIQVKPEYERAIEAVLGGDIFCVILEDSESLSNLIKSENADALNLSSFLPSDRARFKLPTNKLPLATWALDVISYKDEFKYAVSALLSHVYIVPDFETALKLQEKVDGEILVTHDGEVLLPNGKIILGAANEAIGILSYQRELHELNQTVENVESRIGMAVRAQSDIKLKISRFVQQKERVAEHLQTKRVEVSNLKQSLGEMEPESTRLTNQERSMQETIHKLQTALTQDNESILRVKQESKIQKDKVYSVQYDLEDTLKARDTHFEEESRLKVELSRMQVEIDGLVSKIAHNTKRISGINNDLVNFDSQSENEKEFLGFLEKLQGKIAPLKEAFAGLLNSVTFRHDQISEMTSFEEGTLEDLRQDLRHNQLEINKTNDAIEATVREIHEAEVKKAQLELKVTAALHKVVDEYDVPLEKALEQDFALSREEAEAEAAGLRRRIVVLGPINPIAIDEYDLLEERHKLFTEQIEDLQRSKRALMKVISVIDQKMKARFVETFEKVNEAFQAVFESLFPGGQAELIPTDPDNINESGIDIIAQPGGKRLQRLSLLSGGEKSLVALAFSFALYQTRPSPFYILDEVEAALDDMNLQRFISLVARIKDNSQVLIITHQRRTMEQSDALYGVSMQADGVSKLISQKFSEVTVGV
jgi:chromosome segregation protein